MSFNFGTPRAFRAFGRRVVAATLLTVGLAACSGTSSSPTAPIRDATATPTAAPSVTPASSPTATPFPTPTASPTSTPAPTATPIPTPTPTGDAGATPVPQLASASTSMPLPAATTLSLPAVNGITGTIDLPKISSTPGDVLTIKANAFVGTDTLTTNANAPKARPGLLSLQPLLATAARRRFVYEPPDPCYPPAPLHNGRQTFRQWSMCVENSEPAELLTSPFIVFGCPELHDLRCGTVLFWE